MKNRQVSRVFKSSLFVSLLAHGMLFSVLTLWICPFFEKKYTADEFATIDLSLVVFTSPGEGRRRHNIQRASDHHSKKRVRKISSDHISAVYKAKDSLSTLNEESKEAWFEIQSKGGLVKLAETEYMNWVVQHNEAPFYPRLARIRGIEGTVVLRVFVGPNGELIRQPELKSSSGSNLLDEVSLEAVSDWVFPSFKSNRDTVSFLIPLKFALNH